MHISIIQSGHNVDFYSIILDGYNKQAIHQLGEFPSAKKSELKNRTTRDAFGAFHAKFEGVANTLSVIK